MPIITGGGGGSGGGTGTVTNVSSADTSLAVTTPTTTPVITVGSADKLFTNSPPVAAVPFNGQKGTGVANGAAPSDIAAFGQIPAALPPNGPAGGDTGGNYPNPKVVALTETSGPTSLVVGAIPDGQFLKRVGGTLVGGAAPVTSVLGRTGAVVAVNGDYNGVVAAALTGATAATRYVGATASGAPASGTFAVGDFVIAQNGHVFICTVAGTPGTWVDAGTGAVSSVSARTGAVTFASNQVTGTPGTLNASASALMAGLAGTITPQGTSIFIALAGDYRFSLTTVGMKLEGRYGTGAAPTVNAAVTGTAFGLALQALETAASGRNIPFALIGLVTGLTAGTAYWLDIACTGDGTNFPTISHVTVIAHDV